MRKRKDNARDDVADVRRAREAIGGSSEFRRSCGYRRSGHERRDRGRREGRVVHGERRAGLRCRDWKRGTLGARVPSDERGLLAEAQGLFAQEARICGVLGAVRGVLSGRLERGAAGRIGIDVTLAQLASGVTLEAHAPGFDEVLKARFVELRGGERRGTMAERIVQERHEFSEELDAVDDGGPLGRQCSEGNDNVESQRQRKKFCQVRSEILIFGDTSERLANFSGT